MRSLTRRRGEGVMGWKGVGGKAACSRGRGRWLHLARFACSNLVCLLGPALRNELATVDGWGRRKASIRQFMVATEPFESFGRYHWS
jgi:hypothetical protein